MKYTFKDYYHNEVSFSFEDHPFSEEAKHVWVICFYEGKWLLTKHSSRGLEFPGGKVEANENARDAAHREVMEETGALIKELHYIGQYAVDGKAKQIIKNVYFARIKEITEQENYYETEGPVLLEHLPKNIKENKDFSFMMKDDVLSKSMEYIETNFL